MSIRILKPVTPSCRGTSFVSYGDLLWKGKPEKSLVKGAKSYGGRNNVGRITVRHQGGGHKQRYRVVDFKRNLSGESAVVERIEYDPNRTAFIALVRSESDGRKSYIIAPVGIKRGDIVNFGRNSEIKSGSCMKLEEIPVGSPVHNIELKPGAGGVLARAGGVVARVVARDGIYTIVALPSGERRLILSSCHATIGSVSNPDKKNVSLGKAGRSRWLGIRPSVRGVAMNPVDHPLGGGEGKSSGGRHPVTPWGVPTKGKKTRKIGKPSTKYIIKSKRR